MLFHYQLIKGVFTVSKSSGSGITGMHVAPNEEITAYFDQYSGELISKTDYRDYGLLAQWFTYGIPLHEGHLFGWPNKILCLLTTLSLLLLIYYGIKMWLAREAERKISSTTKTKRYEKHNRFLYPDGYTRRCHAFIWTVCFSYFCN